MTATLEKKFTIKMRLQWMRMQLDILKKKKSQEEFASLKFWYGFWVYSSTSKYIRHRWGRPSSFNPFLIWWSTAHPELISVVLCIHNYVKVSSESKHLNCTAQKSIYPCALFFNSFWSKFLTLFIRLIGPIYKF